ncbi:MAG: hypothetical protein B7Y12_03715 [Rhizobiales bacterium 24-66-13]|jgi:dTDP-glucose pyrophosphorylase|nr:MAG: hypothetical protein B7Y61_04155 [Rhizobiales bacterium 35-66-30]OYZ82396.1 MAG: hypothetical protein B7Y12_03715 [Rhizobiales bacterium 24-66-13]OZB08857.1 MAG: hypothetical protein B7X67_07585 [Rhizobiales bacterium 39-66-18]HQS46359.1 nucleotidyltransferase family protein [Xanthobacteraceae bacterium]
MKNWPQMLTRPDASLVEAARIIDSAGGQIAIVTDENGRLLGTVTDADLRKAILSTGHLNHHCSQFMSKSPLSLPETSSHADCMAMMRNNHISQVPLVDDARHVTGVVILDELLSPEILPNTVVIMAGGLGSRLAPLTESRPKPMLDVGGRPLLETIISVLCRQGFINIVLSVNYKAKMIRDHFGDGSDFGAHIKYVEEAKRLGTGGALHLVPKVLDGPLNADLIVMNGDILSKIDLRKMLAFHEIHRSSATMAVKQYEVDVPYGVVQVDSDHRILGMTEKPKHRHFINSGIYAISPQLIDLVPRDEYFDMPTLFSCARAEGHGTCAYPLREYWIDIGHLDDYERANLEFDEVFSKA